MKFTKENYKKVLESISEKSFYRAWLYKFVYKHDYEGVASGKYDDDIKYVKEIFSKEFDGEIK